MKKVQGWTNDDQRRWKTYIDGLTVLLKELPDNESLQECRPMATDQPRHFLQYYPIRARTARAEQVGIPVTGVSLIEGLPWINKGGYAHKLHTDIRKLKSTKTWVTVYPFLVMTATGEGQEKVIGASQNGDCVAECRIDFQNGEFYEDGGFANDSNVGSKVRNRIIDMARTRAFCRTAAYATGLGLVSAEELDARIPDVRKVAASRADVETENIRGEIEFLLGVLKFRKAQTIALLSEHAGVGSVNELGKEDARCVLNVLKKQRDERRGENAKRKRSENEKETVAAGARKDGRGK